LGHRHGAADAAVTGPLFKLKDFPKAAAWTSDLRHREITYPACCRKSKPAITVAIVFKQKEGAISTPPS